jgi:hypothetical protein
LTVGISHGQHIRETYAMEFGHSVTRGARSYLSAVEFERSLQFTRVRYRRR